MMKVWFVTGSSRGLGRNIVEAALMAGDRVVATARQPDQLKDLRDKWGEQIRTLRLDVADANAARKATAAAVEAFGQIDVVVNNAGQADLASIEDSTEEGFRRQFESVFMGVVHVTKATLPFLRGRGSGHFIQISSAGDRLGTPGLAAYQSAKWAVTGFSTTLANEIAPLGIKVTILEPGTMRTDMPGGSSMEIGAISEPYRLTVGFVADMLRGNNHLAPNDPAKVARLIVDITRMAEPPMRLLVGSDAVEYGQAAVKELSENDERWSALSRSVNSD
jgi:NAD(P)-dependent dehydrogenase (short-subunit alcohol dehydrogenase family)